MKATFTGDPDNPNDTTQSITYYGFDFPRGVAVDVPEGMTPDQRKKMAGNRTFHVEGFEPEDHPALVTDLSPDDTAEQVGEVAAIKTKRSSKKKDA